MSKIGSLSKLPDEILQIILEYVALLGGTIGLRLVCHRFDAILSSILLSSISAFACVLPYEGYNDYHTIEFKMNGFRKYVTSRRMDAQLCPIEAHIRYVTVKLSHSRNYGNYIGSGKIKAYKSLLARIIRRLPALISVKLLHNLNVITASHERSSVRLEKSQMGMDVLIASAIKCIPPNIQVEVKLVMDAIWLAAKSVSLRPADWRFGGSLYLEQWPKNVEEVWGMINSLDIGAQIWNDRYTLGLEGLAREAISNRHIFHLTQNMVPGVFLTLQFPNGFPPYLKKLHLIDPLIVNTTEVLQILRNCQYLKDLSLFVVFNIEASEHGLPPGLETLELFESGGTILPDVYGRLRQLRYTFIGEPSDNDMSRVRHFIEHSHITPLELNVVSSLDLEETTKQMERRLTAQGLGRHLLQQMDCDQFGQCRISKRAPTSVREYIINWYQSVNFDI